MNPRSTEQTQSTLSDALDAMKERLCKLARKPQKTALEIKEMEFLTDGIVRVKKIKCAVFSSPRQ